MLGSIYMAPTSLPGDGSGFGIYTTRPIAEGENVLAMPDGPAVPLWDPNNAASPQLLTFRHTYWWSNGAGDYNLLTGHDVVDNQNTFGALPNHHCALATLENRYPTVDYDDSMANRFEDPGAGAFSYGKGREFYIDGRNVQAGEELFLSYVPCERRMHLSDNKLFGWQHHIPLNKHFTQAASLVNQVWRQQDPDKAVLDTQEIEWPRKKVNRYVAALLPETHGELEHIWQQSMAASEGATTTNKKPSVDLALQVAKNALNERSIDWIKETGMCIENLVPLPSIIPQAGTGGVAQFALQRGEIIVPAPLLHLDRQAVKIHNYKGVQTGTQLLMNYCLGHPESDILLYPNTNAIMVNHCSNRGSFAQYCPDGPNAVFTWSSGWDASSEEWKHLSVEEIGRQTMRGLSMEVVALRDIQPGEEVFVDYGVEWEQAWEAHVANWSPPDKVDSWLTAREANDHAKVVPELMSGDIRELTEHPHLFTGCQYQASYQDDHDVYESPLDWKGLSDNEIFDLYADDGQDYAESDYRFHEDRSHWPCTVLREDDQDDTYVVRIHQPWWIREGALPWEENDVPRLLRHYPRQAIHFFVLPYETDQQMATAFRHPIGIPDEIFPEHWKRV